MARVLGPEWAVIMLIFCCHRLLLAFSSLLMSIYQAHMG